MGIVRALAASLLVSLAAAGTVHAAYFVVDTTANLGDQMPGDGLCQAFTGECSLRGAVEEANAFPGPDGIVLPAGFYATSFTVTDQLVIGGAGAEVTIIDAGGTGTAVTADNADLALLDLTVTGANGTNVGGGIMSNGGRLTVIDCTIRDNRAGNVGGGIYKEGGNLLVIGSTISNNFSMNVGGGIHSDAQAHLINTTVSGNRVLNTGGGIHNEQTMTLTNCTVTLNGCMNTACGIDSRSDDTKHLELENTIAANNRALTLDPVTFELVDVGLGGDCVGDDVGGSYNLIQTNLCAVVGTSNQIGADALLGPLQDNGGQTPTHALPAGSPAIDAGNPAAPGSGPGACPTTDQRAIGRPQGAACDVGAYEAAPCGNGSLDPGEDCEDGNGTDGDGCDSNCTATGCGNGVTTAGEECDDGNLADGDCCSSTCTLTVDEELVPAAARGSKVLVKEDPSGALKWKFKSTAPAGVEDLGDPTGSTSYTLCVLDESGATPSLVLAASAPAGGTCDGRPCWRSAGTGFVYSSSDEGPGRLGKVKVKAGPGGTTLLVKGKGKRLRLGRLPFVPPVRVMLRKSDGGVGYGADFGGSKKNGVGQYIATSD
jgi:cysteine-rich repeat protein